MEYHNLKEQALIVYNNKESKREDLIEKAFIEKFGMCSDLLSFKMISKFTMDFEFKDFTIYGTINRKEEIKFSFACRDPIYIKYTEINSLEDLGQFIHTYIKIGKPEFYYNNPSQYKPEDWPSPPIIDLETGL